MYTRLYRSIMIDNKKLTLLVCDAIADVTLSIVVECVQELVKLIVGLATEHRQQLLILSERHHLRVDGLHLFSAENPSLIKLTGKTGMFGIKIVHQEHVMLTDGCRVIKVVIRICVTL